MRLTTNQQILKLSFDSGYCLPCGSIVSADGIVETKFLGSFLGNYGRRTVKPRKCFRVGIFVWAEP